MSSFRNDQSAEILGSVYRNAEMAYEASGDVLKRCPNRKLASEITAQRERYREVAAQTRSELVRRGAVPKDYPPYAKMMSRMGIAMRTANDRSSSNIASLMIRGTTMGIIDMQHAVNRSHQAEGKIRADAQQLLRREQDFCDHLKDYV
ncbi:MAG: hypothetical protein EGR45_02475 [Ruminococcaceae bacterium]|jgi:hypothetical protein|nr:hypothetical protein [Oscillospiraceae bacterium]